MAEESKMQQDQSIFEDRSAQDIWDKFIDGERSMRESVTLSAAVQESLSQYKAYCEYRLGFFPSDRQQQKEREITREVSAICLEMSKDPQFSSFLLLRALQYDIDVNTSDSTASKESILHHLAKHGNVDVIDCLLSMRSDTQAGGITAKEQQTPLILACMSFSPPFGCNALKTNKIRAVKRLLECRDCNINHVDASGRTALLCAFQEKNARVMRALLKKHASVLLTLSRFAEIIPCLVSLDSALAAGASLDEQMQNVRKSHGLQRFLSTTYVDSEFVDFHDSWTSIAIRCGVTGTEKVLVGMILFRIREEFRDLKARDPPKTQNLISNRMIDDHEEEELQMKRFQHDLSIRNKYKSQRKQEKSESVRRRREQAELKEWDEKRLKAQTRLDREFNVQIKGLFV